MQSFFLNYSHLGRGCNFFALLRQFTNHAIVPDARARARWRSITERSKFVWHFDSKPLERGKGEQKDR